MLRDALAHLRRGDAPAAARSAEAAVVTNPLSADARYLLGNAQLMLGRHEAAEASYRRAIAIAPSLAEAHNNLGIVLERLGHVEEAADCYRAALERNPTYAEAHNNLGNALASLDRDDEAIAAFRAAIASRTPYPEAWYNLANSLARVVRAEEAVRAYRAALAQRERFPEALNNLSALLLQLGRAEEAEVAARQAVRVAPSVPESHHNLGEALHALGRLDDAMAVLRRVIELRPGDAAARVVIGNILLGLGRTDEAYTLFREAQALRPLATRRSAKSNPDFAALLLIAPGAANTPVDFLLERAPYDAHVLALLDHQSHDLAALRTKADVVVNLISDADRDGGALALAAELVDRLERPVVNPPARIRESSRDTMAALLGDIPGCRVPRTVRVSRAEMLAAEGGDGLASFAPPFLIRPAGDHGGSALEKCASRGAMTGFASRFAAAHYYLTEFVDFRSADGHYRKYRLLFVNGRILPYHLAIAEDWKVHHFRTDMAEHEWKRREEETFLAQPARQFGSDRMGALQTIRDRVGLDYFGIDCGLAGDGAIVVFEVNATMLVHGETGIFSYKKPFIDRIAQEFSAMLANKARAVRNA